MATVSELQTLLTVDDDQLTTGLNRGDNKIRDFASGASRKLAGLAKDFAIFGVGAAIAIGGAALNASMDWEDSFADVSKTVSDLNETELQELEDTLRNLATTGVTGTLDDAHTQLAGIAALGGQLGVAGQDLDEFTTTVAAFGVAVESMNTEEAAVFFAQFANLTGLDIATDVDNIADAVVHLGNNLATNEGNIANFGLRLGQLSNVGFEPDEILGWGAAMASLGISAELGGTNFALSIADMQRAARDGTTELTTFADTAGMTREEFAQLAETDPSAAFDAFISGLSEMDPSEVQSAMDDLNITGTEQRRVISSLAGSYDLVSTSLDLAEEGFEGNNAAMTEAENKADTTGAKLNLLKNNIHDLAIELGDNLAPGFDRVLDGLLELTGANTSNITEGAYGLTLISSDDIDTGGAFNDIAVGIAGMVDGMEEFFGLAGENDVDWTASTQAAIDAYAAMPEQLGTIGTLMQQNLAIAWDNMGRDIMEFTLSSIVNLTTWGNDLRQTILDATGGTVDIAPDLNLVTDFYQQGLNDLHLADAFIEAIQADLASGNLNLEDDAITIDGITYMFGSAGSIEMLNPDSFGLEGKAAVEAALMEAFASGDEETQNLLLPLAAELDLPIDEIAMQANTDIVDSVENQDYSASVVVDIELTTGTITGGENLNLQVQAAANQYANGTTVINSYGENSVELANNVQQSQRDGGGQYE